MVVKVGFYPVGLYPFRFVASRWERGTKHGREADRARVKTAEDERVTGRLQEQ
jgi:hypothetical protein